jgi:predicted methyltransferase
MSLHGDEDVHCPLVRGLLGVLVSAVLGVVEAIEEQSIESIDVVIHKPICVALTSRHTIYARALYPCLQ